MSKLKENIWQLIGTILAVLAIFATYNVFFLSKTDKQLQIIVDSTLPLIDVKPEAASSIQILYKGKSIDNLILMQMRVENSGNQPIVESDFSREISISFSNNTVIADASVYSSIPPNIGASIKIVANNKAEISPVLLNPDDSITIRFVLITSNNNLDDYQIDGRIVGVKEIKVIPSVTDSPNKWWAYVVGVVVALLANIISTYLTKIYEWFTTKFTNLRFNN